VQLAAVASPRLADLVEHMLTVSDNDVAEALLRQIAVADGKPATFDGGTAAVRDVLGKLGLDLAGYKVLDGSGLSRQDRVAPAFLVRVLALAAATDHPDLRSAVTGLPVAGFTGTLAEDGRFQSADSSAGAGLVRAKTGSLTGVATLAGVVRDKDGQLLLFALMADKVSDETAARAALDRLAAGISGCGCGAAAATGEPTGSPTPAASAAPGASGTSEPTPPAKATSEATMQMGGAPMH
jgi:D-alanyl-D-alanine carboxypeptidase/D-alanyl-D-alanine-endopeptidase (penicillin-binding protein 4)